ncbi:LysR substrate-binding domain-containing protein [Suttonella sp. R2A3]|uniref:LysR substrate-binding domain-containing protein n=1 Tax=Suttonella sp. R2A3 TaxID=2908648 RepID=UPI001F321777|nr:LysR substrate-binding domain-containing protein [Suttonella sp. R2A3]UJF24083.1 LysR substrate-binding domain-containing protein [Suttonella sp. R2A3]
MKLKQFECVLAVVQQGYSVTAAAQKLFMSQPAVSKQIKLFEEALGKPIFRRQSKQFVGLTETGEALLPELEHIVQAVSRVRALAHDPHARNIQTLTLATTNTLATYRLARLLPTLREHHPQLQLNIIEGSNAQNIQMVQEYEADYAWFSATDLTPYSTALRGLLVLETEAWSPLLVVPKDHPFNEQPFDHLSQLADYPLITYVTSHKGQSGLAAAMSAHGANAQVVLTARNADLIKNYVRQGLGLGVIADMAFNDEQDSDLRTYPLTPWVDPFNTYLVWQAERHLRQHDEQWIAALSPGTTRAELRKRLADYRRAQEDNTWTI